ncbi:M10 family metallopeptidase C-terminal domain-containing protein [Microvirga arabica]|uniref:M10 family metallopeptidase C-terminal domain-containing protein n=1 Tax=Microvirga arabica TaxID=1128671 RepID=A0ABV6Y1S7_9HYPH
MSTRTTSRTGWTMPAVDEQNTTLWGAAALAIPPIGTPGNDVLKGDSGVNGIPGFGGNDTIYGYGGNDAIMGGAGNDKLYGGAGSDHFRFDTRLNATTNVDKIMDFKSGVDVIELSRSIFGRAGKAGLELKEAAFYAGKKAHDKDDRIIYDKKTGSLYYDKDGIGGTAQIKFATIANKVKLVHDDFVIAY